MMDKLPRPVRDLYEAMNRFDLEGYMRPFADDALVNDRHRIFQGKEAIRKWSELEIIGDKVTMDVYDVVHHYGDVIVTAKIDGEYDKSDLPADCGLAAWIALRGDKIVQMILLPLAGRKLSKITPVVEATTAFSTPIKEPPK